MAKGSKKKEIVKTEVITAVTQPFWAGQTTTASIDDLSRVSSKIKVTKYININNSRTPYTADGTCVDIKEMVDLCRKAFYRFALLRNTIEVTTEFACGEIYLKDGNKASRDFFKAWLEKINIFHIQDEFYREALVSANIPFYRLDGQFDESEFKNMTKVFGAKKNTIPLRYILLDPASIRLLSNSTFFDPLYAKVLNGYELSRLKNPKTDEDRAIVKMLEPKLKSSVKSNWSSEIELDSDKLNFMFYKKQDYQPYAISGIWSILDDYELYLILKEMDKALTRTTEWIILHFSVGDANATPQINPATVTYLQELFSKESAKRTLTTDFTVKGNWLVPQGIADILGPEKYERVVEDLKAGVNAFLFASDEKFSSMSAKVQVFLERINQLREFFLREFVQPEIKRVAKDLGFKVYPKANYLSYNLRDEATFARVYMQLLQLGAIAPHEAINALNGDPLPTEEEALESQKKLKEWREKGYFTPVQAGGNQNLNGRPPSSSSPKKKINPAPAGASYDIKTITANINAACNLKDAIEAKLCKKYKLKELSPVQRGLATTLASAIMTNEESAAWEKKIDEYIKSPKIPDENKQREIDEIAAQTDMDNFMGTVLFLSKGNK